MNKLKIIITIIGLAYMFWFIHDASYSMGYISGKSDWSFEGFKDGYDACKETQRKIENREYKSERKG